MTFFESIRTVFRKYAEFGGRATRPEFWWFTLFTALVSAALNSIATAFNPQLFEVTASASSITGYMSFAGVWSIAVLLPSLAVAVRRLRDAGRNWTELFWILLPIAGAIVLIIRFAEPSIPETAAVDVFSDAVAP